jgi:hypothetical protein
MTVHSDRQVDSVKRRRGEDACPDSLVVSDASNICRALLILEHPLRHTDRVLGRASSDVSHVKLTDHLRVPVEWESDCVCVCVCVCVRARARVQTHGSTWVGGQRQDKQWRHGVIHSWH